MISELAMAIKSLALGAVIPPGLRIGVSSSIGVEEELSPSFCIVVASPSGSNIVQGFCLT